MKDKIENKISNLLKFNENLSIIQIDSFLEYLEDEGYLSITGMNLKHNFWNKYIKEYKTDQLIIDEDIYIRLKQALGHKIKPFCDFCNSEITKKTFGYLSDSITCCNNMICLTKRSVIVEED